MGPNHFGWIIIYPIQMYGKFEGFSSIWGILEGFSPVGFVVLNNIFSIFTPKIGEALTI